MKIAVPSERIDGETRVAASPETVKKFVAAGHDVIIEQGAGLGSGVLDEAYKEAGATLGADAKSVISGADVVLKVRKPTAEENALLSKGQGLICLLEPHNATDMAQGYADMGVTAFAMEFIPRITRAQSMDVLSSQANLAGYRAVIDAAHLYGRAMPMMMTAAGTVAPARAFIMGVGVAGLQAIATARRLGASVSATDVRPATKEQVASLGAKFVAVEDEEFKAAETAGGYAKQMSEEYQKKQQALIAEHIAKQDLVITTALIPGREAPELVTEAMVKTMRPGSVIVDLAAAQGGNCKLSKPDEVVEIDGVKIFGPTNLPASIAADASALYAKNLLNFLPLLTAEDGAFAPNWEDDVVKGAGLTRDGKVVHPSLVKEPA